MSFFWEITIGLVVQRVINKDLLTILLAPIRYGIPSLISLQDEVSKSLPDINSTISSKLVIAQLFGTFS